MNSFERDIAPIAQDPKVRSAIYLDHHATTPIDPRVAQMVMRVMTDIYGNANSTGHGIGNAAASVVEQSRAAVADLVGAEPEHVHFTSGSTEAIYLAISHAIGNHRKAPLRVALSRVEHRAVVDTLLQAERLELVEITWIDVDDSARIVWPSLETALQAGVELVCIMAANNEVGTLYPVNTIAQKVHDVGATILVDATQGAGRMTLSCLDSEIDYLALSGHKLNGPKGVGALISPIYDPTKTYGLATSHRATPNVPGIAGLGEACRLMRLEGEAENTRLSLLRDRLQAELLQRLPGMVINGEVGNRLSNNLNFSVPGAPNDVVVARLRDTVALSTGSACNSGAQSPSHVLMAMGLSEELLDTCLRIGLGRQTTEPDIDHAAEAIATAIIEVGNLLSGDEND
ncbi:cysteine desulfurase family protein [Mesorhizobium sp.]|uniref:cysteine desulfurase family protein n=1 Tax=Mesorhizobium sp. TaxID=1871066 RepID=UPI00120C55A9|nr:cysteine desulfurase family protein [Mesorhizobium sp.]TIN22889.1 MAG: cysteine desulfurase [Mesorhizobium sp.]